MIWPIMYGDFSLKAYIVGQALKASKKVGQDEQKSEADPIFAHRKSI